MAKLTLRGVEYTLAYSPWAVVKRLKKEAGISILDIVEMEPEKRADTLMDMDNFSALLWGGLIHAKPDLTIAEVDQLFGPADLAAITKAIVEALGEAFGAVAANPTT